MARVYLSKKEKEELNEIWYSEGINHRRWIYETYHSVVNELSNILYEMLCMKEEDYNEEEFPEFFDFWKSLNIDPYASLKNINIDKIQEKIFEDFVEGRIKEKDFRAGCVSRMSVFGGECIILCAYTMNRYYYHKILEKHPLYIGYREVTKNERFPCHFRLFGGRYLFFFDFPKGKRKILKTIGRYDEIFWKWSDSLFLQAKIVIKMENLVKKLKDEWKQEILAQTLIKN